MATITQIRIHPAIGIARLGNSPEFFVGPEAPGKFTPPAGYKDAACRVRRQAARFRLFGFDGNGAFVRELEHGDPEVVAIEWTAHLVNRKAAGLRFEDGLKTKPLHDPTEPDPAPGMADSRWRNHTVPDRSKLVIDPGERTLDGPGQAAGFNTGRFMDIPVPLGEMRTDAQGRLMILGGFGTSAPVTGSATELSLDTDGWYDDVSDGPVKARVTLAGGGGPIDALSAWVIVAPPKFAPAIQPPVSLYDSLLQIAKNELGFDPAFTLQDDAKPFYESVVAHQWVSGKAAGGHGGLTPAFPPAPWVLDAIVNQELRKPGDPPGPRNMPLMWSRTYANDATVTPLQYQMVLDWKAGTLPAGPAPLAVYDALDRAALEPCIGGNFFPGIEAGWGLGDPQEHRYKFLEPFRLDPASLKPGDISKQMAIPWQGDFYFCKLDQGIPWWPAARPDDVHPEAGGAPRPWTEGLAANAPEMVENWHRMGFVVPKGAKQVETERTAVCRALFLVIDRSHVSKGEVADAGNTEFKDVFYVLAEGFTPAELGVGGPGDVSQAPGVVPTLDGAAPQAVTVAKQDVLLEHPDLNTRQRVTFVYGLKFAGEKDFGMMGNRTLALAASKTAAGGTYDAAGEITLVHSPNPYMVDGSTVWLSTDLRVFKVTEGVPPLVGKTIPVVPLSDPAAEDAQGQVLATTYIQELLQAFNAPPDGPHPFGAVLPTDPHHAHARLELARTVGKARVYNFAVARVRYRGDAEIKDLRVFFRLFTTAATGLDYNQESTYRRSNAASPVALLGLQARKPVTIPCYAAPRTDTTAQTLTAQTDAPNLLPAFAGTGGVEKFAYFGCWLDFNQTTPRFPDDVGTKDDGPWPVGARSIQELIRGMHQCLAAEIHLQADPIPPGATPGSNDNLAQRNLVIVQSDNPGSLPTRVVQHTFEVKAQPEARRLSVSGAGQGAVRLAAARPDELMIRWNTVPRTASLTLYFPDVDADEVMRLHGRISEAGQLERVDAHTVRCLPGDVSYVPLPPGRTRNTPALATLELPEGIRRGQAFDMTVHQVSGPRRAILGAFQLHIPVSTARELLEPEIRSLSVLRHIARSIPAEDPWRAVFARYLDQVAARVRGFGGDPDAVAPSPDGDPAGVPGLDAGLAAGTDACVRRGWITAALLAVLVIVCGIHPLAGYGAEVLAAVLVIASALWWHRCKPSAPRVLLAALLGLGAGAAVLALLVLIGGAGTHLVPALAVASVAAGLVVAAGAASGGFRLGGSGG